MTPDRVFVVRSGPNLERLRILPPNPSLKRGRKYLVGYVGVMGSQEGIQYLLEAARHIVQRSWASRRTVQSYRRRARVGKAADNWQANWK